MYSVLNKLSYYIYFYIPKTLLHTLFCLLLKSLKAFSVSLSDLFINRDLHEYTQLKFTGSKLAIEKQQKVVKFA